MVSSLYSHPSHVTCPTKHVSNVKALLVAVQSTWSRWFTAFSDLQTVTKNRIGPLQHYHIDTVHDPAVTTMIHMKSVRPWHEPLCFSFGVLYQVLLTTVPWVLEDDSIKHSPYPSLDSSSRGRSGNMRTSGRPSTDRWMEASRLGPGLMGRLAEAAVKPEESVAWRCDAVIEQV